MYNWSTDTTKLEKDPDAYQVFVLEQQINFGLNNQRLYLKALKKHWDKLDIDTNKRSFLKKLIWPQ